MQSTCRHASCEGPKPAQRTRLGLPGRCEHQKAASSRCDQLVTSSRPNIGGVSFASMPEELRRMGRTGLGAAALSGSPSSGDAGSAEGDSRNSVVVRAGFRRPPEKSMLPEPHRAASRNTLTIEVQRCRPFSSSVGLFGGAPSGRQCRRRVEYGPCTPVARAREARQARMLSPDIGRPPSVVPAPRNTLAPSAWLSAEH